MAELMLHITVVVHDGAALIGPCDQYFLLALVSVVSVATAMYSERHVLPMRRHTGRHIRDLQMIARLERIDHSRRPYYPMGWKHQ